MTRALTVWQHVNAYINQTAISWPTFSDDVVQHYHTTVESKHRRVEFSNHHDPHERMRINAQTVRRFERDVKFGLPVDLEEGMVMALPESYRKPLQVALAARTGLLASTIPGDTAQSDVASVADIMRETAEALEAVAPMLADDGKIDHNDAPKAAHAEQQLLEAMAACNTMLRSVRAISYNPLKSVN